jgi:hypothetical protein
MPNFSPRVNLPIVAFIGLANFMILRLIFSTLIALALSGCSLEELLADPRVAQKEADGKAIGGACRHAIRSIEDCYRTNEKASKTAIFTGWREMDQYMRENKIEGQPSAMPKPEPEEVIIDDKKAKSAGKDKPAAQASAKAPAKPAAH